MKNLTKLFLLVGVIISVFSCGKSEETYVGALLPLTGNAAYIGQSIKNGLELANELSGSKIKLIVEDTQGIPKNSISAFNKLKSQYGMNIFIPALSSTTNAILPISTNSNDLLFATCVSSANITRKSKNLFRLFVNANADAKVMLNYAVDSLKMQKFYVLYVDDDFGQDYFNTFHSEAIKRGAIISGSDSYSRSEMNFRDILIKLRNQDQEYDAVYILGYDNNLGVLIKQYSEMEIKKPILSIATVSQPAVTQILNLQNNKIIPPIYYTNTTLLVNDNNTLKEEFLNEYKQKYAKEPNYFSAFAFDLMNILIATLDNTDVSNAKNYMVTNPFSGVMGKINFDETGDANFKMIIEKLN